ncbi:bifunctional serine/threonine-protein kinase/ABC transporter substrate-binding protein [Streptomyces sp. NBC_01381]|uniref:bifunctional serine/threonine-protein kinase/ABC transporter substrate-binding protein n=1 Tax=Streptomyces sp. NBC_01381 TaxID=2903845 RepID=UPI0022581F51|nr:bifunctional serine/threonine-protein kinase/ABC transporter substrate-binding protein [Streptomyces sp. NBC_01381]MCX4670081.1 bifunctional serine/threonine-protein kinase/ABC transporter substrate-binding protein [Streptomyces sp. NBC_01381]
MRGRLLNGRYELLAPIGAGGMGQVWRARDRSLGREVAVKLFVPSTSAGESEADQLLARFRQEARAAAALDSPYIVAVHDHGTDDGTPYLVMALVQGRSLDQVLRESVRVPVADALRWAADICRALDAAHSAGVVHRDIKPGNVMITPDGTAKVVDFGIATFMERVAGDSRLTQTGQLPFGSVPYLAPERFRQEPGDGRTDLYALGCVLYELLIGRPPFTGSAAGVMYNHVNDAPLRPSAARGEVTRPVERLVLDLLAKDPEDRPADAATALERVLAAAGAQPPGAESTRTKSSDSVRPAEVPPDVQDSVADSPSDRRPATSPAADPPHEPTVRVGNPGGDPGEAPAVARIANADTRPAVHKDAAAPAAPDARQPRSRKRPLIAAALVLAVGIPTGLGIRSLTSDSSNDSSNSVGKDKETIYEIGVAHDSRHVGAPREGVEPDEYETSEFKQFTTQQLRTVKSAFAETLGTKGGGRFRIVPVTADPDVSSRKMLAKHPRMLAVIGDTSGFAWVHDTDEAFLPEISTCSGVAHADGAFAIPADDARQGTAMARYLLSQTKARRVLVAEDELWANREDGIGTALRRGGITTEALNTSPSDVKPPQIPALATKARAEAVVVPANSDAGMWTKRLRADGFKGPVLTQSSFEGVCQDSEKRTSTEATEKNVPAGVLRTRNYTGEPDQNLPAQGNQELYDGALALATALGKLPADDSATSLRHTLDREIQRVSVNGVLDEVSFEKRRSARGRPVWIDRRGNGTWQEIGKVDDKYERMGQ